MNTTIRMALLAILSSGLIPVNRAGGIVGAGGAEHELVAPIVVEIPRSHLAIVGGRRHRETGGGDRRQPITDRPRRTQMHAHACAKRLGDGEVVDAVVIEITRRHVRAECRWHRMRIDDQRVAVRPELPARKRWLDSDSRGERGTTQHDPRGYPR